MMKERDIKLELDGIGIVMYSPGAVKDIPVGCNFLMEQFNKPDHIGAHIRKGDVTGFCTGTPGSFELKFRQGYPDEAAGKTYPVAIRLGIQVVGGEIRVSDLYWLMDFDPECPPEQVVEAEDGVYHVTVLTKRPDSGRWGDHQTIYIYLNEVPEMPELMWNGAPPLFT